MYASSLHHLKSLLLDGSAKRSPIVEQSQFFVGQERFVASCDPYGFPGWWSDYRSGAMLAFPRLPDRQMI
jgi:hypothetical protein